MEYDDNLSPFYEKDDDGAPELFRFDAIMFVDLMRAAKRTWEGGHPLHVNPEVIADAVSDAPVKIVSRAWAPPSDDDNKKLFAVWCEVPVKSVDYTVPIRVLIYHEDWDRYVFEWTDELRAHKINLDTYIESVELMQEKSWGELLD